MSTKTLLILGGYGNTGKLIAQLLLSETNVRIILAGRNQEKAQQVAAQLNSLFPGNRASGIQADASDVDGLKQAFMGVDLVVVASSTAKYVREVTTAALEAGTDYLDIQYSPQKVTVLQSLAGKIKEAGRCFITEAGYHPGLPAVLVRYVGSHFDHLEKAIVGGVIRHDWRQPVTDSTMYEFTEAFKDSQASVFKNGTWQGAKLEGMMDYRKFDFGLPLGKLNCVPMFLEEMRAVPKMFPSIKETGFYIAGFHWFVDWFLFPLIMIALRLWPEKAIKPMAKLMWWGLTTFSSPPYGVCLKVEATGEKDDEAKRMEVSLYHEDGYMITAIPVVACLLQYLDGSIKKPGLYIMANLVEPNRLMEDMKRMGVTVSSKEFAE